MFHGWEKHKSFKKAPGLIVKVKYYFGSLTKSLSGIRYKLLKHGIDQANSA